MSFFSLIKLCRIVEEMGKNVINSRSISTKLNRRFSRLVMYQGMMTFVLMLKKPGIGLLTNSQGSPSPGCRKGMEAHINTLQAHAGFGLSPTPSLLLRFYPKYLRLRMCHAVAAGDTARHQAGKNQSKIKGSGSLGWPLVFAC